MLHKKMEHDDLKGGALKNLPREDTLCVKKEGHLYRAERFSLVLFSSSSLMLKLKGTTRTAAAPGCLCLNETEEAELLSPKNEAILRLFFHPETVNSIFNFKNIRGTRELLSFTERQDRDFLEPFIARCADYFGYLQLGPSMYEKMFALVQTLDRELSTKADNFWPCRSRSYLLELLFVLFKRYRERDLDQVGPSGDTLFTRVAHYIHCNYTQKILIKDLCQRFGTNKTSLNRTFHAVTGSTVMNYIHTVRINAACLLLRDTRLPVQEIVYRTGFNDLAHFGRIFRRTTGVPPAMYRNQHGYPPCPSIPG